MAGQQGPWLRKDGRWLATLQTRDGSTRYLYGQTREEAEDRLQRVLAEDAAPRIETVESWLTTWMAGLRRRPSTIRGYQGKVNRFIKALGEVPLAALSPDDLDHLYSAWLAEGLSASSVNQSHRILHRALHIAVRRGLLDRNVTEMVDAPTPVRREFTVLTPFQTQQVLAAVEGARNEPRWWFALVLGMRQGECLGVSWDDINLDARTVTVRRALQRVSGHGLVFVDTKTAKGRRAIPLPDPIPEKLSAWRVTQQAERRLAGTAWQDEHKLVFTQPNGRPIRPEQDWHDWRALLVTCGLPLIRVHDARHTAATLMLGSGVAARVASEVLGHSTTKLTLDTYTHVSDPMMRGALDSVTRLLRDTPPDTGP